VLVIIALLAAGLYIWRSEDKSDAAATSTMDGSSLIAMGKSIYASQCAACHGANLEGQENWRQRKPNGRLPAPPHDASGHTWHHDDETLFNLTKYGLSALVGRPVETDMPAYDGVLTDMQIRAVLAYIKSRWPREIQRRQAEMTRQSTPAGS
jgi:mono/diheme cytochrome c family protein